MKTSHKALILGLLTEGATTLLFVFGRPSEGEGAFPVIVLLLHIPAFILVWIAGAAWFLAIAIEAGLWVFLWFRLLSVFDQRKEKLTLLALGGHEVEKQTND